MAILMVKDGRTIKARVQRRQLPPLDPTGRFFPITVAEFMARLRNPITDEGVANDNGATDWMKDIPDE